MPKLQAKNLTEAEQRVMEVLWSAGNGTVSEVLASIDSAKPLAFNTVQTTLRILEGKGHVRHREDGRAFRYFPVLDKAKASRRAVDSVVRRFFGSPGALAVNLLETESLSAKEIADLKQLLRKAEREA